MNFQVKLKKPEWVSDLAFSVDILNKLNELNIKLQGKGIFAHELFVEIVSFQVKQGLFSTHLSAHNFVHFPVLQTQTVPQGCSEKHSEQVSALKAEFAKRFADFKSMKDQFNLLKSPFLFDIEEATTDLQLKLIDLQADHTLKEDFKNMKLPEFYALLSTEKFGHLKKFASKICVFFASTYICEQTFSCMTINKSKNRSLITNSNLHSVLRITTSSLTPTYAKLVQDTGQMHKSH